MSFIREPVELDDAWPACPQCGHPRLAECPHCRSTGVRFEPADYDPDGSDSNLFMCPTCDDVFDPDFYRFCEYCGYDFGHGKVAGQGRGRVNMRVLVVAVTVVVVLAYLFGRMILVRP